MRVCVNYSHAIHGLFARCINRTEVYIHFLTWEPAHVSRKSNISINRDNTRKSTPADSHVAE